MPVALHLLVIASLTLELVVVTAFRDIVFEAATVIVVLAMIVVIVLVILIKLVTVWSESKRYVYGAL